MEWLFPSIVATLVGTLVLTATYLYLYKHDHQKFLLIWGVGWLVYATRFAFMLLIVAGLFEEYKASLLIANQLCVLFSGIILLHGTFVFTDRETPKHWYFLTTVAALWIFASQYFKLPFLLMTLPTYLFLGTIYVWTGIVFLRHTSVQEAGKTITGWTFILWGIHKMDYPFIRPVTWFAPWGYLVGATMEITVALGMLIIYFNNRSEELRISKEKFKNSEEKFKALADTSPLAIYMSEGIDQKAEYINPTFTKLFGYTIDEVPTINHWWPLAYPDTNYRQKVAGEWQKKVQHAIDTNTQIEPMEAVVTCRDGSKKHISWGFITTGKQNWACGLDLTERKLAEEELKFTQFAVDSSSDAAFFITSDAKFYYVNDAAVNRLGYSREELLNMSLPEVDPNFPKEAWESHWQELQLKKTLSFETRHQTKDGEIFPVEVVANYIKFGDRAYNCAFVRDISERKEIETKLQQAQKMEAIGTLAGGIAHDFNNILTVIIGYGEMVLDELPAESDLRKSQSEVLSAGLRAKDLVQQILAFSRQTEFEKKPIQIHLMVKETVKMLRATIPASIEIRQNIMDCGVLLADTSQLHQILMNLCTNAFQAMPKQEGVIGISLKSVTIEVGDTNVKALDLTPGKYAKLEVSDTGQGMDKGTLDKIFNPYFTTKEKGKGTGLGLAIVHGIVKSLKGHISVYSEKNRGTKFCVYLPLSISESDALQKIERGPSLIGNEKILVVDDEEAIVGMEKQMLEKLGYHVSGFTSVTDALKSFQKNPQQFDLVITDMTMPGMNGADFTKKLRALRSDIPVILCTGFSELIDNGQVKTLEINKYLTKPVSKHELAGAIREVLDACKA